VRTDLRGEAGIASDELEAVEDEDVRITGLEAPDIGKLEGRRLRGRRRGRE